MDADAVEAAGLPGGEIVRQHGDVVPADKQGEVFLKEIRNMKGKVPHEYA